MNGWHIEEPKDAGGVPVKVEAKVACAVESHIWSIIEGLGASEAGHESWGASILLFGRMRLIFLFKVQHGTLRCRRIIDFLRHGR